MSQELDPRRPREAKYSPIVELRQYTLYPGKRDVLIELFEKYFIEKQEEMGAELVGQFRELKHPNLFVWLRGYSDMETRQTMLESFYSSETWMAHREEANSTMADSDNVLLLREAWPGSGFHLGPRNTDPEMAARKTGLVSAMIHYFDSKPTEHFLSFFKDVSTQALAGSGGTLMGIFTTEYSPNNFPKLPVREGENVFAWFSRFENEEMYREYLRKSKEILNLSDRDHLLDTPPKGLPEILELTPTPRSRLS
jgi:NIPSNAP